MRTITIFHEKYTKRDASPNINGSTSLPEKSLSNTITHITTCSYIYFQLFSYFKHENLLLVLIQVTSIWTSHRYSLSFKHEYLQISCLYMFVTFSSWFINFVISEFSAYLMQFSYKIDTNDAKLQKTDIIYIVNLLQIF